MKARGAGALRLLLAVSLGTALSGCNVLGSPLSAVVDPLFDPGIFPPPKITALSQTAGDPAGGDSVTLTGIHFLPGARVTVGGSACTSVTFVSDTSLVCVTPAHALGSVNIVVTNPDDDSYTLAGVFVYQPAPTLTAVTTSPATSPVTAGTATGGTILTLTGTHFTQPMTISLGGSTCAATTFVSATSMTCTTASHAPALLDVSVKNAQGQTATLAHSYQFLGAPALNAISDRVFPSTQVSQGSTVTLDYDDTTSGNPGGDAYMSYTCKFIQAFGGTPATDCAFLPGSPWFDSTTGTLSWKTTPAAWGPFTIKVTGTNLAGSGSQTIHIDVQEPWTTAHLTSRWDAWFATQTGQPTSASLPATWSDLTTHAYNGTLTLGTSSWATSAPYALACDGSARSDFGLNPMSGQSTAMFDVWVKPNAPASGSVLFGNSANGTGNGFSLRQSRSVAGAVELAVGKTDYKSVVLADNPLAYWRLDEAAGNLTDSSIHAVTGTVNGSLTYQQTGALTSDPASKAIQDSGAGSASATIATLNTGAGTWVSVEFWMKWDGTDSVVPFGFTDYDLDLKSGAFGFNTNNADIWGISSTGLANHWVHVVAEFYNGVCAGNCVLYINGVQQSLSQLIGAAAAGAVTTTLNLGDWGDAPHFYFTGLLDEFAIYNGQLTQAQVSRHYNAGLPMYQDKVLAAGPVGYWRLGDANGTTAVDSSTPNHSGTYNGGYVPNQPGAAAGTNSLADDGSTSVTFDGTSGYVSLGTPAVLQATPNFSAEAWFKTTVSNQVMRVIRSRANGFWIDVDNGSVTANYIDGGAATHTATSVASTYADGNWHHTVMTYDSANLKIYVDGGTPVSTATVGAVSYTGTAEVAIGRDGNQSANYFKGSLAEVAIYDYALSSSEISAHSGAKSTGWLCRSRSTLANGTWNFLSGLWDGTTATLLVNGVPECSISPAGVSFATPATSLVAGATAAGANGWSGSIAVADVHTSGVAADVKTGFDATANRFRATLAPDLITNGLVLELDPSNASRGLSFPGAGCMAANGFDLSASHLLGTLMGFDTCGTYGWQGAGTASNPYSLVFDGTNDFVVFPDNTSLDFTSGMTVEGWFNTSNIAGSPILVSKYNGGNGFYVQVNLNKLLLATAGNSGKSGNTTLADSTWYHYAATYDGVTKNFYIDGAPDGSQADASGFSSDKTPLEVGDLTLLHTYPYGGQMGSTMLYNRALLASEVKNNFDALANRYRAVPVPSIITSGLQLDFDAANSASGLGSPGGGTCTMTSWWDLSSSYNNGTLAGFAGCGAGSGWNGTGSGATPYELAFDGTNDQVSLGSTLTLGTAHTVEVWIKYTGAAADQRALVSGTNPNRLMWINGSSAATGSIQYEASDGAALTANSGAGIHHGGLTSGTWYQLVLVRNGTSVTLYKNGAVVGTDTLASNAASNLITALGVDVGGTYSNFKGSLGNAMIYNRALSAGEVRQNCQVLSGRYGVSCP